MENETPWDIVTPGRVHASSRGEGTRLGPRQALVVADAVADDFSRAIISSSVSRGKTVEEICFEQGIPQSSCYRRLRRLLDEGVMAVERTVITSTGRKSAIYRSTFSRVEIRLEEGVVSAYATINPDVSHKLRHVPRSPDTSFSLHGQLPTFVMQLEGSTGPVAGSP